MVSTLHTYVPLHCYCGAPVHPTSVHTLPKHLVSNTNSNKVMGIYVKKKHMAENANNSMINK